MTNIVKNAGIILVLCFIFSVAWCEKVIVEDTICSDVNVPLGETGDFIASDKLIFIVGTINVIAFDLWVNIRMFNIIRQESNMKNSSRVIPFFPNKFHCYICLRFQHFHGDFIFQIDEFILVPFSGDVFGNQ